MRQHQTATASPPLSPAWLAPAGRRHQGASCCPWRRHPAAKQRHQFSLGAWLRHQQCLRHPAALPSQPRRRRSSSLTICWGGGALEQRPLRLRQRQHPPARQQAATRRHLRRRGGQHSINRGARCRLCFALTGRPACFLLVTRSVPALQQQFVNNHSYCSLKTQ